MFQRWPLMLHAEPRLGGVFVTSDARNPAELRGKQIGFARLRAACGTGPGWRLYDDAGLPVRVDGRELWVGISAPGGWGLACAARTRQLKQRVADGSLNILVERTSLRAGKRLFVIGCAAAGIGWAAVLWMILKHHSSLPPSQVLPIDMPVKLIAFGLISLIIPAYALAVRTFLRRSCLRYRLTSASIELLDGPLAGRVINRADVIAHRQLTRDSIELRLTDRKVYLQQPPMSFSAWMGTEKADRKREHQRLVRGIKAFCVVVAVALVAGAFIPADDPSKNAEKLGVLIATPFLIALCGWMIFRVTPRLAAREKQRARRERRKLREMNDPIAGRVG